MVVNALLSMVVNALLSTFCRTILFVQLLAHVSTLKLNYLMFKLCIMALCCAFGFPFSIWITVTKVVISLVLYVMILEMTNKLVLVGIVRTCLCFDGEFPHWLGMGMGMGNPRLFQLGIGMVIGMYISSPYLYHHLNY